MIDEKLSNIYLRIVMPDDYKQFDIPVIVIAKHRAEHYKNEFDNDLDKSLEQDTIPLFLNNNYEIVDWASNNMNWEDVEDFAVEVYSPVMEPDYKTGWTNGEKEIKKY